MNKEYNIKNKYLLGFTLVEIVVVIAVIVILAAVLIPTFSKIITSAQITKHHSDAKNIYTEYLQNVNDNLIDDLAIKTEEDIYVIYIDGEAIDGIYSYDEVKEKFKYSLVKKYAQDNNILLVYDYDANNTNVFSKISIEVDDVLTRSEVFAMISPNIGPCFDGDFIPLYIKMDSEYGNTTEEGMENKINLFFETYIWYYENNNFEIIDFLDKTVFEDYVIAIVPRTEIENVDYQYVGCSTEKIEIFFKKGTEKRPGNFCDIVFIPKFVFIDVLPESTSKVEMIFRTKLVEIK